MLRGFDSRRRLVNSEQWRNEEMFLWNRLHNPASGRRRPTMHGLTPGTDRYKKVKEYLQSAKDKDHAAGWEYYDKFIHH